jgi:hypothetical protein
VGQLQRRRRIRSRRWWDTWPIAARGGRCPQSAHRWPVTEEDDMGQQIACVPIKHNQVEMMCIAEGEIVEWWVENDRLWMSQQLGFELEPQ